MGETDDLVGLDDRQQAMKEWTHGQLCIGKVPFFASASRGRYGVPYVEHRDLA